MHLYSCYCTLLCFFFLFFFQLNANKGSIPTTFLSVYPQATHYFNAPPCLSFCILSQYTQTALCSSPNAFLIASTLQSKSAMVLMLRFNFSTTIFGVISDAGIFRNTCDNRLS
mmetsp:Transcript_10759/g.23077  ORF Transcript_10759/g.23077 Transcript_10759/m.23077 type:complete len:113 (+) Transcript_10759:248-586(+)